VPTPRRIAPTSTVPAARGGGCPGASALSNLYINDGSKYPVRCGPQAERPVTLPGESHSRLRSAPSAAQAARTRIVPLHVYKENVLAVDVPVPDGYRRVWDDGRLNPRRAEQSVAGYMESQQVWTRTVPRRLVDPFETATVTAPKIVERPNRLRPAPVIATKGAAPRTVAAINAPPKAAPKSAKAQAPAAAGKPRYLQVAVYAEDASARAAAQRVARTGLTTRLGTLTRGGQSYRVVLAGPFAGDAAERALATARKAGFPDARLR
jgi:hypothetical protein